MAIVGIEMDQVRKTPQGDVPVPINMAYNHHHDVSDAGEQSPSRPTYYIIVWRSYRLQAVPGNVACLHYPTL